MNTLTNSSSNSLEIDIVRKYLSAFSQNNIHEALECIHPHAIWHIDGDSIVKTVGIIQGHKAIKKWLENFPKAFQPINFSISKLISSDNDVFVIGRFRHLVLKTNTIVDSDYIIKFTIENYKITHYQIFEDSLLLSEVHRDSSHSRKVTINETIYEWDDIGEGSPIIFLHGLFLDRTFWTNITQNLSQNRCISFDMPGHAKSGWREELDLDGIAEDIAIWMKEYCIDKATLVGHSQGAMVAMRIAVQYPDVVENLILINTSAQKEYEDRIPCWIKRENVLLSENSDRLELFKEIQNIKQTSQWLENNKIEADIELSKMMAQDPQNLAKALKAATIDRIDIRDKISKIKAKTIVLSGEMDRATPYILGEEIAKIIPNTKHKILAHATHSIPIEFPEVVLDAINNLVRDQLNRE
ncbi:alpha/beta fold hydrolase [Acinetobacter sp. SM34]|uniref:alpha/beta fold hydrolase n=1 Tax=Acinetobacter sp. SM34 TaxID=1301620 RepID=UPI001EDA3155|nr:alpha/beta fold hydrolase [Acinetobacter sp. SM34]MCG2609691.1 alpha/beta fold hydrolase [Acinetobacter sp. SM34]